MSKRKHNSAWKNPANLSPARMKRRAVESIQGKSDNEIAALIKGAGRGALQDPNWKALKSRVFATYGYRCMKCGTLPRDKRNSNVDHIKPRKYFPELALEFDNMQVLCGRCNKDKANGTAVDYRPKSGDAADEWSDHNLSQFMRTL